MILATCIILLVSRVWIHHTIRLHTFSDSKGIRIILLVEGDRGAGARENRGREGYGRREKKGREAGEKFQKASFR